MQWLFTALGIWNAIVLCLYGADKHSARKGGRRISEKTLLLCAVLGGGPGALLGMLLFRHKTRKWRFRLLVPIAAAITVILIYCLLQGWRTDL